MINNENGDSLIGVYKRCLRIGMELGRRGHEIYVFCTGREAYHDETVELAQELVRFVDFSFRALFCPSVEVRRRYYRRVFNHIRPDIVVVGEVPLAGTLLDSALCASGLGIPIVVLDNAYSPELARAFYESHAPMVDGVVLSGPSSFQMPDSPSRYCAVPPFISGNRAEADGLLHSMGLDEKKYILVLAYERKAGILAASLMQASLMQANPATDWDTVFLTPDPEEDQGLLERLSASVQARIHFIRPPSEAVYFSLLARSKVAIGKCGFMQVSESLSLGVPFLGIYYRGCFNIEMLPADAQKFVHATPSVEAQPETLEAFERFLTMDRNQMDGIHCGGFDGLPQAADFIEHLPRTPRSETTAETANMGYTPTIIEEGLSALHPGTEIKFEWSRSTRLRNYSQCLIDCVTARYKASGKTRQAYLWGRRYSDSSSAEQDRTQAEVSPRVRQILFRSQDGLLILEKDAGEGILPPLHV